MVVISITCCPQALRGDLTRWFFEIDAGIYVGNVSARVREALWKRIVDNIRVGRVIMVYNAKNEQRMDFRVHNAEWEPIDFDGLKLMMHPSTARRAEKAAKTVRKEGYSKAAKARAAKQFGSKVKKTAMEDKYPSSYVVIDLKTTGTSVIRDCIIEIGVLKVINGTVADEFQTLIKSDKPLSNDIIERTGITNEMLVQEGIDEEEAIQRFVDFIGELPLVSHNLNFDFGFLRECCDTYDLELIKNQGIDTLQIAQEQLQHLDNLILKTIAKYFGIETNTPQRCIHNCKILQQIFSKLIEKEKKL